MGLGLGLDLGLRVGEPLTFAYWVHVHAPMRLSPLNFLGRTSRAPVTSWCSGTLVRVRVRVRIRVRVRARVRPTLRLRLSYP